MSSGDGDQKTGGEEVRERVSVLLQIASLIFMTPSLVLGTIRSMIEAGPSLPLATNRFVSWEAIRSLLQMRESFGFWGQVERVACIMWIFGVFLLFIAVCLPRSVCLRRPYSRTGCVLLLVCVLYVLVTFWCGFRYFMIARD